MADLNDRISEILNDPDAMEKVRLMAENLLNDEESKPPEDSLGMPDSETLSKIMGIISHLKTDKNDSRTALLLALKPHLSSERQKKVDTAVRLLRLIEVLPYLKESGLLDFEI